MHGTNNSCGFLIIHILYMPLTSSYHPRLSNNNQPHSNLLKTTKATICKATDCIRRGMIMIMILTPMLSPSALLGVWFQC